MQQTRADITNFFAPVEREDYDIDAAFDACNVKLGRSGTGIVTIGLFGGKRTTSDPDEIRHPEDGGRGLHFVRSVARAVQNIDDFDGTARFPLEIEDAIYSSSSRTDPFGAYRLTMWLGDLDNRAHHPVMDGLTEYFETEHDGRYDIRAIEFDFDTVDPKEKFRAVFPWGQRENDLSTRDSLEGYDAPAPIRSLTRDLRETPIECRDYKRLDITVHYYNSRSDRDGKYDREFTLDDCYGAGEMRLIEKDRRTPVEQTLDAATTRTRKTTIAYELSLTVDHDEIDALIEDDDEFYITSREDAARHLGQTHHENEYGTTATVGIVNTDENDDSVEFTLSVTAQQR